jgi:hypothetical protein
MHADLIQALHDVQAALGDPVDRLDGLQERLASQVLEDIEALLEALSADES